MQAEHDDAAQRTEAPILAVLNIGDDRLQIPSRVMAGNGYCGDIAAGPNGGLTYSCQQIAGVLEVNNFLLKAFPRRAYIAK